jgi:predicted amidohydrolase YtcJ
MEEWLPKFSAAGLTGGIDFGVRGIDMDEGFGIYKSLEGEGKLPLRIAASYYWNVPAVDPIPLIKDLKEKHTTELLKPKFIKINVDGGSEAARSACFVEAYTDAPDLKVKPIIPADVLNDVVQRADAQGIDMVAHTIGDRAVRLLLDAYEGAIKANPQRDRRLASSHTSLVHPDDVPRFAELDVTADLGINWGALDPYMTRIVAERIGEDRMNRYLGAKELMDAGARVSFSSDWAASSYFSNHEPLVAIQMAMTRRSIGKPDMKPLGGEKRKCPSSRLFARTPSMSPTRWAWTIRSAPSKSENWRI